MLNTPNTEVLLTACGLIRYTYFEKKPSINFSQKYRNILDSLIVQSLESTDFKGLGLMLPNLD